MTTKWRFILISQVAGTHASHSRPRRAGSPGATPAGHSVTPLGRCLSNLEARWPGPRNPGGGLRIEPGVGERRTRLGPRPGVARHPLRRSRRAVSPPRWELIPQELLGLGSPESGLLSVLGRVNRPRHSPETQHPPESASAHSPSLSAMAASEPGGVGGSRGLASQEGRGGYEPTVFFKKMIRVWGEEQSGNSEFITIQTIHVRKCSAAT